MSSSIHTEEKRKDNLLCYIYNHTEKECNKEKAFEAYCRFMNRIGQGVDSEHIRLHLMPGKEKSYCL